MILNQGFQILINVKAKSGTSEKWDFCHFERILYHPSSFWKYASFEGV